MAKIKKSADQNIGVAISGVPVGNSHHEGYLQGFRDGMATALNAVAEKCAQQGIAPAIWRTHTEAGEAAEKHADLNRRLDRIEAMLRD